MEVNVFGRRNPNIKRHSLDRFVLSRELFSELRMRQCYKNSQGTVDIWNIKDQQNRKYKKYLANELGLGDQWKMPKAEVCEQPWPCIPRKRSCLSSNYNILDLPYYSYTNFPDIVDWGNGDTLVAALRNTYHYYSWKYQRAVGSGLSKNMISCCRFNPSEEVLLVGTNSNLLELHDKRWIKRTRDVFCECFKVTGTRCQITCIDWSPTGNSFVAGCTYGAVSSFDRYGRRTSRWNGKNSIIKTVRVSPDTRYVAVSSMSCPDVDILLWPSLQFHSRLHVTWDVKSIVWHPWRSALLGVGVSAPDFRTMIVLWDTPSGRLRYTNLGTYIQYHLDGMLFSHRTGEMVLSLWNSARATHHPNSSTQLVVMSDHYTVVDQSGDGRGDMDRVQTMVFSPDGTKLEANVSLPRISIIQVLRNSIISFRIATATLHDDLMIWNFLPEEESNKKTTKLRKFSSLPEHLDSINLGFVIR